MNNVTWMISTYNQLEILKQTLGAVFYLSLIDDQIVVLNDGSNDGTAEYLVEMERHGIQTANNPVSDTFNKSKLLNCGLKIARHNYVIQLDADKVPQGNDFRQAHVEALNSGVRAMTFGQCLREQPDCSWLDDRPVRTVGDHEEITWRCAYGGNSAFRRDEIQEIGGWDDSFDGAWGDEDSDLGYRLFKAGFTLLWLPDALSKHPRHAEPDSRNRRNADMFKDKHGFSIDNSIYWWGAKQWLLMQP